MWFVAAAAVVSAGIQIYGQWKANKAQADAERQNASFYKEQADFAEAALGRELAIYEEQTQEFRAGQIAGYGTSGVDLSGSPLLVLATTTARAEGEKDAMRANTAMQFREAMLKAGASLEQANRLGSFANNALPAFGTALGAATQVASLTGGKK